MPGSVVPSRDRGIGTETGAVMLMILGVAGLFLELESVLRLLPLFVIYFGVRDVLAVAPGRQPSILILVFGIWLEITAYGVLGLDFLNSWPILVVLVGIALIFDAFVADDTDGPSPVAGR